MRTKFICKNCGTEKTVVAEWKDLKPKICSKCKTSFIKEPDKLLVVQPRFDNDKVKKMEEEASELLKKKRKTRRRV